MAKKIDLSIIVVSYNTSKLTVQCLTSIKKNEPKNYSYEIIVIDNDSKDDSVKEIQRLNLKNLTLIQSKTNLGFAGANRLGIKESNAKYILLLNSDTKVTNNLFDPMLEYMDVNPDLGIVSCALKNADGSDQVSGGYFPNLFRVGMWMTIQRLPFFDHIFKPFHPKHAFTKKQEVDWVTGAFFLMNYNVIDKVGSFDPDYFMYTEEVDLCFRAKKKGFKVEFLPAWNIIHYGGASSTQEFAILSEYKGIKTFYKKHYPKWQYPFLRFFLKLGAFWRMFLVSKPIYEKAFAQS